MEVIALAAFIILAPIACGYWAARLQNPPNSTVGNNTNAADCEAAKTDFFARHSERCMAIAAKAGAQGRWNVASKNFNNNVIATGVALAAGLGALALFNFILASICFTAAAALTLLTLYYEGIVINAQIDLDSKEKNLALSGEKITEAIKHLREKCPVEADTVIVTAPPCPPLPAMPM